MLVTSPPLLRTVSLVGTGREPRVEEFLALEESPYSLRLEHLLVTDCAPGSLEGTPLRRTGRRLARRSAPREGKRMCERIEMLFIVLHSFARVRIAPRHARVDPELRVGLDTDGVARASAPL